MNKKPSFQEDLKQAHTPAAIQRRLAKGPPKSHLRDFVYGAIDGAVTTFAVVTGSLGAKLSTAIVIILGFCNLIADGFSMAVSNYLATRAEKDLRAKIEKEEKLHIELVPEGEKEEIRQIFEKKGFKGNDLERIVSVISSDVKVWLTTMMHEELGLAQEMGSPFRSAAVTFFSFICIGFLPLLPFVTQTLFPHFAFNPFLWSAVVTGFAFFLVGALKSRVVAKNWFLSGLETFLIGGAAAFLAYLVGLILRNLIR